MQKEPAKTVVKHEAPKTTLAATKEAPKAPAKHEAPKAAPAAAKKPETDKHKK